MSLSVTDAVLNSVSRSPSSSKAMTEWAAILESRRNGAIP